MKSFALLFAVVAIVACQPPPPTTIVDTAAEVRCVAGELEKGVKDPITIAADCALPSIDIAIDIVASLDSYADKRAACPGTVPPDAGK